MKLVSYVFFLWFPNAALGGEQLLLLISGKFELSKKEIQGGTSDARKKLDEVTSPGPRLHIASWAQPERSDEDVDG